MRRILTALTGLILVALPLLSSPGATQAAVAVSNVQNVNLFSQQFSVAWDTDTQTTATLSFFSDSACTTQLNASPIAEQPSDGFVHLVQVSPSPGLTANTTYYYKLSPDSSGTCYSVKTAVSDDKSPPNIVFGSVTYPQTSCTTNGDGVLVTMTVTPQGTSTTTTMLSTLTPPSTSSTGNWSIDLYPHDSNGRPVTVYDGDTMHITATANNGNSASEDVTANLDSGPQQAPGLCLPGAPGATVARVLRFTAHIHGEARARSVTLRWRMASTSTGVGGFNLYAGAHRLNARLIRAHRAPTYRYRSALTGRSRFTLHVILNSGRQEIIPAR